MSYDSLLGFRAGLDRATVATMKRVVLLLSGVALSALAVQACSDSTDDPGDGVEAGASSGGSSGSCASPTCSR